MFIKFCQEFIYKYVDKLNNYPKYSYKSQGRDRCNPRPLSGPATLRHLEAKSSTASRRNPVYDPSSRTRMDTLCGTKMGCVRLRNAESCGTHPQWAILRLGQRWPRSWLPPKLLLGGTPAENNP